MIRNRWAFGTVLGCVTLVCAGIASQTAAQPMPEQRIQEVIRAAAERVASSQQPGSAPAGGQAVEGSGGTLRLSLDDAVARALDRNIDIAVQRLNPQILDYTVASAASAYRPILGSVLGSQSAVTPSTSTTSGAPVGSGITAGVRTFSGAVSQNAPWGGGSFVALLSNTRSTTTSATALFDPIYSPSWTFQFNQPLIRGFAIDQTRQQIVVAKINRDISDLQLQSTIINTLSNVREAYWNYVYAIQAVDVAKQSVGIAEQLVRDNRSRVEIGVLAPIDVVTAQSQAAQQRQALVQAEATRRNNELALKRLLVSGTQDPSWKQTLEPIDQPDFSPELVDIDAAVRKALTARTDLNTARKNNDANAVTFKYLRNQGLPQADLIARYGLTGLGGTEYIATGSGINRVVTGVIPGGFGNALSSLLGQNYPTWSVSMNVSYPLGMSIVAAQAARARVQMAQAEAQTRQIELQVATEVTSAAINVQSSIEAVQAAQAAQDLAQRTMEAEQGKFEVGISTNYNVIITQRDLNTAKISYLQAVLNYRNALVELDRAQQTTLQSLNVTLLSPVSTSGAVGSPNLFLGNVGSGCAPSTAIAAPCIP
ncbi:MAG TPA: TolC family protein [Vicinamibacterales bacterium]|nr:TolC family protein [Vicinamibacterales bacterium]